MLFKVEIVKLIDVVYVFNFSSVTAASSSPLCLDTSNTLGFPVLKKSATIAAARHSSGEHFNPRQQAQLLNESIIKQAEAITQIAKKQGKTKRMLKKIFLEFFLKKGGKFRRKSSFPCSPVCAEKTVRRVSDGVFSSEIPSHSVGIISATNGIPMR